jgi:hypothetical protein
MTSAFVPDIFKPEYMHALIMASLIILPKQALAPTEQ